MAKFSLAELKTLVASVVTKSKISNDTFSVTRDNIVGLVDKIGKIVTLDSYLAIDKLADFEGEYLSFGKTIEEWQQDLIEVSSYDSTGAGALSPHDPTYRPPFYSYTLGRKVIKTTIRNNDVERAVHFVDQLVEIASMQMKRLQDSMAQYRYGVKREMLGKFVGLVLDSYDTNAVTELATSTKYVEGTQLYKQVDGVNHFGIVVKEIPATNTDGWVALVGAGKIIEYNLLTELAKPVDTSTGEAFIKALKGCLEQCNDISEGNSLNGNTLGAIEGVTLFVRQNILPSLDVDTMAGAFNLDKIALPSMVIVLRDFGSASSDVYAVLMDSRAMRLHNTYRATRENMNGDGDFLNIFEHTEDTAWISRNAYIHVFEVPQA